MRFSVSMFAVPCILLCLLTPASGALYEYNFDGGSILNGGTASDGDLTPFGPNANDPGSPMFISSVTDSNGVTRNDVYDFSVGGGTRSYFFSNIANQNVANWTVGLWVNANDVNPPSQFSSVFMNDTFQINNTAGTWRFRGSNTEFGDVLADTWQLIVLTNDGTNTRAYVDGVLGDTLGNVGNPFNEIGIGTNRARDNNGRFLGFIDDVFIADRAFSDSEIAELFRIGTSGPPVPEPATAVLALFGVAGLTIRRRRA